MPLPTFYATGAASVNGGATTITFTGALLGAADLPTFKAGDLFHIPAQPLVPGQRLASVDYVAGTAELWVGWPGATVAAAPYEVRFVDDGVRSTAQTRRYLERLGQLAALGIQPDAFGDFADRAAFDDEARGYIFLSLNGDGVTGGWTLYVKETAASGDWDAGQSIEGPVGPSGVIGNWRHAWVTTTAYAVLDGVEIDGSSYLCKIAHVADVFATDLAAGRWELSAAKGGQGNPGNDGRFSGTELVKVAAYTALASDVGKTLILNKATADTLSFDAVAALGATWMVMVKNIGAGTWSLDPNGAETIDGAATISLAQGESVVVSCNGAALRSFFRGSAAFTQFTAASSAGPAQLDLAEDTDNGTNKISIKAPASIASDKVVTLPDATGTVVLGALGSTDNRLVRSDGAGGQTAQGSAVSVDDSGNMSGVGTLLTAGRVTVNSNAASLPAPTTGTLLHLGEADAAPPSITFDGFAAGGNFRFRSSEGTAVSPTATINTRELGRFSFFGYGATGYSSGARAAIAATSLENWTDSAQGVGLSFLTTPALSTTMASRLQVGSGLYHPSATGGDKGNNTINFGAVYDDNTLLTCMALQEEFLDQGEIDLAKWDALVPDQVVPGTREMVPVTYTLTESRPVVVIEEEDGRLVRRVVEQPVEREVPIVWAEPVYDEAGEIVDAVETPLFDEVVVPEQLVPRVHGTARLFAAMVADGFDPRDPDAYFAKMRTEEALPGMPTKATWQHNSLSAGDMMGRLWLASEMLAIVANVIWAKLKDHEQRLDALEAI